MLFRKTKYNKFYSGACKQFKADQNTFMSTLDIESYANWDYHEPTGIFTFSSDDKHIHFEYQCIGSISKKSNTWLWAYENDFLYPCVTELAQKIYDFGVKHKFDKLSTPKWSGDETDGWDMLAVSHKITKSVGYYRLPLENISLFIAFTKIISDAEVQRRKNNPKQFVECESHGIKRPAYVCQHLINEKNIGFHEPFESIPDMALEEDDDFQAWCNDCEKIRSKEGEWNKKSEEFANIKLVCENCFFTIKENK